MTALTERQLATLRALLAGRTVTPDHDGLVEAWATVGNEWAEYRNEYPASVWLATCWPWRLYRIVTALAAMRDDLPAWAETARRLNEKEATNAHLVSR